MRRTQTIFNLMIKHNYYRPEGQGMCIALQFALSRRFITTKEYLKCKKEIETYMLSLAGVDSFDYCPSFMRSLLAFVGLPHENENLMAIYTDWASRPQLM